MPWVFSKKSWYSLIVCSVFISSLFWRLILFTMHNISLSVNIIFSKVTSNHSVTPLISRWYSLVCFFPVSNACLNNFWKSSTNSGLKPTSLILLLRKTFGGNFKCSSFAVKYSLKTWSSSNKKTTSPMFLRIVPVFWLNERSLFSVMFNSICFWICSVKTFNVFFWLAWSFWGL